MSSVRARRMISGSIAATLLVSPGCTTSGPNPPKGIPKPKGDEVIALAGNGTAGEPEPGAFATQTPLTNPNAMVFSPADGALLVAADTESQEAIVRIDADGRVSTLESPGYGPMRTMAVRGGDVWTFWANRADVGNPSALARQSLSGGDPTEFFGRTGNAKHLLLTEVDDRGQPLRAAKQQELIKSWDGEGMVLPTARPPVVVMANGKLYQALGEDRVRAFSPDGYASALGIVGGKNFITMAAVADGAGGFIVAGPMGAVKVPIQGTARAIRFRSTIPSAGHEGWGATILGNRDILIASQGQLYRITDDGTVNKILTGKRVTCHPASKLADFGIPSQVHLARLPDGTIAMSSANECNRVYGFRLTDS